MRFVRNLLTRLSAAFGGARRRLPPKIVSVPPADSSKTSIASAAAAEGKHQTSSKTLAIERGATEGPLSEVAPPVTKRPPAPLRNGYFIQIGLDFGTSYCKCVYRDVMINKAWVYLAERPADEQRPFLMPSALKVKDRQLVLGDPGAHYHRDGLSHVKRALVMVALEEWDDPVLAPFWKQIGKASNKQFASFVAACGVYLIGGVLGNVRRGMLLRIPDFGTHPDDYMPVNMAIPVADAERASVNHLFQRVLDASVEHADELAGHPAVPLSRLSHLVPRVRAGANGREGSCFIYPEVSAGVQGFVRSRVSRAGIYMFSDTGAATVDQSVFILQRIRGENDRLVYLHASVLPFGSSEVERLAAQSVGDLTWQELEAWRQKKEADVLEVPLSRARSKIGSSLLLKSVETLFKARRKLDLPAQLHDTRVIFGGGGHTKNPYERSVIDAFEDQRVFGTHPPHPDRIGMPHPRDLELPNGAEGWMSRLSVAYGLAFPREDLADHMYPSEVSEGRPLTMSKEVEYVGLEHT